VDIRPVNQNKNNNGINPTSFDSLFNFLTVGLFSD